MTRHDLPATERLSFLSTCCDWKYFVQEPLTFNIELVKELDAFFPHPVNVSMAQHFILSLGVYNHQVQTMLCIDL